MKILVKGSGGFGNASKPNWRTPADFTNAVYWWTADAGITYSSLTDIASWEDQINGYVLQQNVIANQPTFTSSWGNLNNQAVVSFNGSTDGLWTLTPPADFVNGEVTILSVFDLIDAETGGPVLGTMTTDGNARLWVDTNINNLRVFNQGMPDGVPDASKYIEQPVTTGNKALKIRYDGPGGGDGFYALNTLTETSYGTGGDTGTTSFSSLASVALGAGVEGISGTRDGSFVNMAYAEQVWIYGNPSDEEMDSWKAYVNNKYGTIIV